MSDTKIENTRNIRFSTAKYTKYTSARLSEFCRELMKYKLVSDVSASSMPRACKSSLDTLYILNAVPWFSFLAKHG